MASNNIHHTNPSGCWPPSAQFFCFTNLNSTTGRRFILSKSRHGRPDLADPLVHVRRRLGRQVETTLFA